MSIKLFELNDGDVLALPEVSVWDMIVICDMGDGLLPITVQFFGDQVIMPGSRSQISLETPGQSVSLIQRNDLNWVIA